MTLVATSTPSSGASSSSVGGRSSVVVRRASASHRPKWQRYQHTFINSGGGSGSAKSTNQQQSQKETYAYQKQYSHVYSNRLRLLKDQCWDALLRYNNHHDQNYKQVNRVLELQEDIPSSIVGTFVKEQATGGNDDSNNNPLLSNNSNDNRCRSTDQLFLEDESGRVALVFDDTNNHHHVHEFCTGVVAGVMGTVDCKGSFHVHHVIPPTTTTTTMTTTTTTTPLSTSSSSSLEPSQPDQLDPHVLLVSSLQCGDPSVSTIPREMLISYLQGQFTSNSAKVCQVIIAGSGPMSSSTSSTSSTNLLDGINEFDRVVGRQITGVGFGSGCGIPVDIVPSSTDPTTKNWPQRPLHSSLLPISTSTSGGTTANNKKMVHCTPNPYAVVLGETRFIVGTDGHNVRDLQRHILTTKTEVAADTMKEAVKGDPSTTSSTPTSTSSFRTLTELEALERTLVWSNMCPTAPNSIGAVPTSSSDFVLTTTTTKDHASQQQQPQQPQLPSLYFCGNCNGGFDTKIVNIVENATTTTTTTANPTRLVCIPKFHETGEAVLVNLRTLDVELLRFQDE